MEDESGTTVYIYDENNRLTEQQKCSSQTQLKYDYDAVGNITKVTDKKGNETSYTSDKSSRMETVTRQGQTTTYSYDDNGRRTKISYPGGVTQNYDYDKDNQLKKLQNKKPNGAIISEYSYEYNLAGRQTTKTDSYGTTSYNYDNAGRVKGISTPGKTTIYTYDKNGNRANQKETYTSMQPRGIIDEAASKEIQYILKKSIYTYTNTDQLLNLVEVMYDASSKEVARKTTKYIYDNNGNQLKQISSYTLPDNTQLRPVTKIGQ